MLDVIKKTLWATSDIGKRTDPALTLNAQLLTKHEKFDQDARGDLPLTRIWTLTPLPGGGRWLVRPIYPDIDVFCA